MNIFRTTQLLNNRTTINSNRWSIEFVGLGNLLDRANTHPLPAIRARYAACATALTGFVTDVGTIDKAQALQLSLVEANIPGVNIETQSMFRFNDSVKAVTRFSEMDDMTVTFYDYIEGSASAIMQLWHAMVGDKVTGAIGFKKDFVLPAAYFYVYGPDAPGYEIANTADPANGKYTEVPWLQKYRLLNLFPKNVNLGQHGEDPSTRRVEVTFAIDNVYPIAIQKPTDAGVGKGVTYIDPKKISNLDPTQNIANIPNPAVS